MLIGAIVAAYRGKRGWHIIPHADHLRSIAGLVQDGIHFSATAVCRSQALDSRQPLLVAEVTTLQSDLSDGRRTRSTTVDESAEVVATHEIAAQAKLRALREQSDQHVHSSQPPIKVIGKNTTHQALPTVELKPPGDDANSRQLKATLGKQGTMAARITLSQLTMG